MEMQVLKRIGIGAALLLALGSAFVGPASAQEVTKDATLKASTENGVPASIDKATWEKAGGTANMSMGSTGTDTVVLKLHDLVPNGQYTAWWVNMKPSMSMGPAGGTGHNEFKADGSGNATTSVTVASKNDYQVLDVVYHADGKTHGNDPGKMGSESFNQLSGPFPGPSGMEVSGEMAGSTSMSGNTSTMSGGNDSMPATGVADQSWLLLLLGGALLAGTGVLLRRRHA